MTKRYEKPQMTKVMDLISLSKKVKAGSLLWDGGPVPVGCGSIGIDTEAPM